MRLKSKAQRRKFAELLMSGKITPEAYERWNRDTGSAELPEHVKPKLKRRSARKRVMPKVKRKPARKPKRRSKARSSKARAKARAIR